MSRRYFRFQAMAIMRIFFALIGLLWVGVLVVRADTHYVAHDGQTPTTPYTNSWVSAARSTAIVNNTCSGPAQTNLGSRNIGLDPLLVNTNIGNYRPTAKSPCINTGTNQSWMWGAVDLDGRPRINSGTVDIGAYENQLNKGTIISIF